MKYNSIFSEISQVEFGEGKYTQILLLPHRDREVFSKDLQLKHIKPKKHNILDMKKK